MANNELQKQDGTITPQQKNDAQQINKLLKEHTQAERHRK